MTQKSTALYRLAQLALKNVSELKLSEQAEAYRIVAIALIDDRPDFAELATQTASKIQAVNEQQLKLNQLLNT